MLDLIKQYGAIILATYGAALSTYNFYDGRRKNRRSVKVTLETAMFTFHGGGITAPYIKITAVNIGNRPVTITNVGLRLPDGRHLALLQRAVPDDMESGLPATLHDGAQAFRFYKADDAEATARNAGATKMIAYAMDSTGKTHLGDSWTL